MQFVPLRDFDNLLDECTYFLLPWLKPNTERLRTIIENRSMHTLEWCLYHGEAINPTQVEKRVRQLRQTKNLPSDDRFILRWLEKNLNYMKLRAEAYEDPKFNL